MKDLVLESIQTYGSKYVSDIELLIAIGIPQEAANALMTRCNNQIGEIAKLSIVDLSKFTGITTQKATILQAALEIGRRRQSERPREKAHIESSLSAFDILDPLMRDLTQEAFYIILLDRRIKVIKTECIHLGGMSAMVVDPKVIFQKCLEYRASSVILSHNHPSGAPSPSIEDIRLTEKIKACGSFLDCKVLDHIIIGDGCYYSFADEGKI